MTEVSPVVHLRRTISAPRSRVFRAWTDPEALRSWWGPGEYRTPEAEVDLRPGGHYRFVMQPPDGSSPMVITGEYHEVIEPERLVYSWRWEGGVPEDRESVVTVEFREVEGGTEVAVTHGDFSGMGPLDQYEQGWISGLEKLQAYVAG